MIHHATVEPDKQNFVLSFTDAGVFVTTGRPIPFFRASIVIEDQLWSRIRPRPGIPLKCLFHEDSWQEVDASTLSIEDVEEQGTELVPWTNFG